MMDGGTFTKRKETTEEFWARMRKAREEHDRQEFESHQAWMKRMEASIATRH